LLIGISAITNKGRNDLHWYVEASYSTIALSTIDLKAAHEAEM
jgi:hypothetical protein